MHHVHLYSLSLRCCLCCRRVGDLMSSLDCQLICQLLEIVGPTRCFVVGVVLRDVKERIFQIDTNMGFVRHINILLCAQGAMARYMVWQNACSHPEKPGILRQVRRCMCAAWADGNRVKAVSADITLTAVNLCRCHSATPTLCANINCHTFFSLRSCLCCRVCSICMTTGQKAMHPTGAPTTSSMVQMGWTARCRPTH